MMRSSIKLKSVVLVQFKDMTSKFIVINDIFDNRKFVNFSEEIIEKLNSIKTKAKEILAKKCDQLPKFFSSPCLFRFFL